MIMEQQKMINLLDDPNTTAAGAAVNNTNKKVTFKNCAPFANCITEINNAQVNDAQKINVVMPMYNLAEQ